MRTRIMLAAVVTVVAGVLATGASAAPNTSAGNKLQCYVVSNGTCTPVTDGYTLTVTASGGGVALYSSASNLAGKLVGNVDDVAYDYASTESPRFTFQTADGRFVSVESATCNDGAGRVDVIHDPTCSVAFNDGSGTYVNWAAFVAANPTTRIAPPSVNTPFILLDVPGSATITNVQLGKAVSKVR